MPARRRVNTVNREAQRQLEAIGYADLGDPPINGTGDDRVKTPSPSQDPVDVFVRKRRAARKAK